MITVGPDRSLAGLEDLLISRSISGVPVVEKGRLGGIVLRSGVVRALSLERSLAGIIAEGLASRELLSEEGVPGAGADSPWLIG